METPKQATGKTSLELDGKTYNIHPKWEADINKFSAWNKNDLVVHTAELEQDFLYIKEMAEIAGERFDELCRLLPKPFQVELIIAGMPKDTPKEEVERLEKLLHISKVNLTRQNAKPAVATEDAVSVENDPEEHEVYNKQTGLKK